LFSAHALEINQASEAELDSVRGMGPAMSRAILAERQSRLFADWADLMRRVKGIRSASAERFAAQGLTINGQTWSAPPPTKP
jgi:competence protein ComEA